MEYPRANEQPFRIAIELKTARKGYVPKQLIDPIETQLWEEYLQPSGCQHGIFVVLWFRDDDRYPFPRQWPTPEKLAEDVLKKCKEVEEAHQVKLASYVVDLTTIPRRH